MSRVMIHNSMNKKKRKENKKVQINLKMKECKMISAKMRVKKKKRIVRCNNLRMMRVFKVNQSTKMIVS